MDAKMCLQHDEAIVGPFDSISSFLPTLISKTYVVVEDIEKVHGLLTPADVLAEGHQLAIDCIRPIPVIHEFDSIETALIILNNEKRYVLPVYDKKEKYIGSITYKRIIEEVGLIKRQPVEVKVTNIIGTYDIETAKQSFLHELYHNTKNPLQVIYSSVNLCKAADNSMEKENLLSSISESTKQIEDTISSLFYSYFRID